MGLHDRSMAIVGGDTMTHSKPHPAPILKAAEICNINPAECLYVGDDLRDIEAGRAAGMKNVAAAYGYCGCDEPVNAWGADTTSLSIQKNFTPSSLVGKYHSKHLVF